MSTAEDSPNQHTAGELLQGDTGEAVAFLRLWYGDQARTLTAIDPTNKHGPQTRTFLPDQDKAAEIWINLHQGKNNLYFSVNQPYQPLVKKASKSDIGWARAFHIDLDPIDGQNLVSEQDRILASLKAFEPPASVIVYSGGGYQGFWLLEKPIQSDAFGSVEAHNKSLEKVLGGDHCHNIDRIMRVPGTVNIPNEKKRTKGRVPAVARIVEANWDRRYSPDDFNSLEPRSSSRSDSQSPPIDIDQLPLTARIKNLILGIADSEHRYGSRSEAVFAVLTAMVSAGCSNDLMRGIFLDSCYPISAHVADQPRPEAYLDRQIARAREKAKSASVGSAITLDPKQPLAIARAFLRARFSCDGLPSLIHHAEDFYEWRRSHYARINESDLTASLYDFLEQVRRPTEKGTAPFDPNRTKIENVMHALKSLTHASSEVTPPCWLDRPTGDDLLISCANGLLRLSDEALIPHSPRFFNTSSTGFKYDPEAAKPEEWNRFLKSVWPSDIQSIETLQEIFGYLISGDDKQQKMFLIVGPPRSGKGTIGRVLTKLVGSSGHVGVTLTSLAKNFGLAPLIGKGLAIVPDARLRGGSIEVVERLLAISGSDELTIDRKFKDAVTVRLPVRFLFLSNEIPVLGDSSGAIASRFISLELTQSYLGKEDHDLDRRLARELPAILNWAIVGARRLQDRGYFIQPDSAARIVRLLIDLSSPIKTFLDDCCQIWPGFQVETGALFVAWKNWCEVQGREHPGNEASFGRDLHAAAPHIQRKQHRLTDPPGKTTRVYEGIKLRPVDPEPALDLYNQM